MSAELACLKCGAMGIQAIGTGQYRCDQCGALMGIFAGTARCPRCQNAVLGEAAFCHTCGAALQHQVTLLSPCPACSQQVPGGSRFCPYCGTTIPQPEPDGSAYPWSDSSAPVTGRYRESDGCPSCGRTIGPVARSCPYCGVDVEAFIAKLRQQTLAKLDQYDQADQEQRQRESARQKGLEAAGQQLGRSLKLAANVLVLMLMGLLLVSTIVGMAYGEEITPSFLLKTGLYALFAMLALLQIYRFGLRE